MSSRPSRAPTRPPLKRVPKEQKEPPEAIRPEEAMVRLLLDVLNERANGRGPREMERYGIDKATASHIANRTIKRIPQTLDRIFAAYAAASGETATALRDDWYGRMAQWLRSAQRDKR